MKSAHDLFDEISASRPVGHFDAVEPLLRRFCEIAVEGRRQCAELSGIARDAPRAGELIEEWCAGTAEMCDLAEILGLLPGDRGKPPPQMQ